ncbi:Cupin domain protein [Marinomonas aquimarina]|uniref:Cupin domain protein n=1 Tax=Marinomonas aquimarina TaxID=295068 RepID=A0A1A8T5Q6_9GAMM|nr:cupin domain-containing protein [Marinomonas aquimarina]SBS26330.1 Cupin domain protein [Marinomonas aquimarina]
MKIENIFSNLSAHSDKEQFEDLIKADNVRIERIHSPANCELSNEWYDQPENEWVTVLQGYGVIAFEDARIVTLKAGDHLLIEAHEKHRVIKTSAQKTTVWLAVFF